MRIGVDLLGSDVSSELLFSGVLQAARELKSRCCFTVLATESMIRQFQLLVKRLNHDYSEDMIRFVTAEEEILMDDPPLWAVRKKKQSSLHLGIGLLKTQEIQAFVSAGNTGALTAVASLELKFLPGIDRPALLTLLPSETGKVSVLDVGANLTLKPHQFVQLARLGVAYQHYINHIQVPNVGLLNIGVESLKGTQKIREAYLALKEYCTSVSVGDTGHVPMHFCGNIEGRDVFLGKVDVLVTDGFTGNIFLKTCEGVSSFILDHLKRRFPSPDFEKHQQVLKDLEKYLDYTEYPGAVLCGVQGIVVKCHGSSSAQAMISGIKGALHLAEKNIIDYFNKRSS